MRPGEIIFGDGDIYINDRDRAFTLSVTNTGDRPVEIGSHCHFAETNAALSFDRDRAIGMRPDAAAGTTIRIEPGQEATVDLISFRASERE